MVLNLTNKSQKDYNIDYKVVSNIKALGIDMINEANSGHPGIVLGFAPILYRLYAKHLIYDRRNPNWINRDRFIMSAGHGSALLYATLFMSGFDLSIDDLKNFRKYDSKTPGHPEIKTTPGVDLSTGPLGQGIASAVGMAIGEAYLNAKFKVGKASLIDHYTYVVCGDGDLMEGISYEAASLAGSLGLNKLIVLYDSNEISLDGTTKNVFDEDIIKRFESFNWDTYYLDDPYNFDEFDNILEKAKKTDKPSFIKIKTIIGEGLKYQGTNLVHGKPLDKKDITKLKKKLGIRDIPFTVLKEASDYMKNMIDERNDEEIKKWEINQEKILNKLSDELINEYQNLALEKRTINFEDLNPIEEELSGRDIISKIINQLDDKNIMCLCTDTKSSTKIYFKEKDSFTKKDRLGKNIECGVRELGAAAIQNGLELMGIRTISSTFLSFSNYMIPSIRMAALMNLNTTYIFTHDSVLTGEDGPTHQPIEQIDMLRLIPNVTVFRPCDINEIIGSIKSAFNVDGPTVIIVSKDEMNTLENTSIKKIEEGAYILKENEKDDIVLISTGSEVKLALSISKSLEKHMINARVVSMPSIENFMALSKEGKEKILPKDMPKVVLELSSCLNFYKVINSDDIVFNVTKFMKSGNKNSIIDKLGYDTDTISQIIANNITQRM